MLVAIVGLAASVASAQTPGPPSEKDQPRLLTGNQNCAALPGDLQELRINNPTDGTFTNGTLTVTIDVRNTDLGPVFDWTSNIGVDAVVVKGGPDANAFEYDPPNEQTSDKGLHAPVNPQNDKFFGLSHISFCYDAGVVTPKIKVEKSGNELSKVGDKVTYTYKITNNGSIPLTLDSIIDNKVGDLAAVAPASCDNLAVGESCTFSVNHTIPQGASDPYVNTVTVKYKGTGVNSAESATDTDTHSVNLFQPSVKIIKTGPDKATVGQTITYKFTIINQSSNDSPNLILDSVSDSVLGNLAAAAPDACDSLASGASCTFSVDYTVKATDPNPLVNEVRVHYHPKGFPNDIKDKDDHSVNVKKFEGCTPGYWKNHPERWNGNDIPKEDFVDEFKTTDTFNTVFGVSTTESGLSNNTTLLQALKLKGGGKNALARHAVAALLNASSDDVNYPFGPDKAIELYQAAVDANPNNGTVESVKNKLANANEAVCPLN
jgi:uncharacterized repeat protein (TIGR01451 family)